jgi:recombination protein RecA
MSIVENLNRCIMAISDEKAKALEMALRQIDKDFGKGTVMRMGDNTKLAIEVIPTGALTLDNALGIGGVPRGRIIEIFGPEASGKTTVALHIVAQAQKAGGVAAYIDAEHALDPVYAANIGVDVENMLISQPDYGEQAMEIADALIRSSAVDVIVVDSVAALVPKAEIEGDIGDAQMGLQARLMSQVMRKLTGVVNKSNTTVIFINQLRMKIGVVYGNPETTTGGRALAFYASIRLDVRRVESLKKDGQEYGTRTKVKVVKNKLAPPFRQAEFNIVFGKGISSVGCIFDVCVDANIIKKSGAWFSYKDKKWQGESNAIEEIEANKSLREELEALARDKIKELPTLGTKGKVIED